MEPGRGPAALRCRRGRVGRRRGPGGPVRPRPRDADRPARHRPRRRAARTARRRDAAADDAHAAGRHRPGCPHRPRRGRRGVAGRDRPGSRARPGRAGRELAGRGCGRLHPGRRARLSGPPLRAGRQQRHRGRARDPRRRPGPRRRRPRAGPVLGGPGGRRGRRGDRAGDAAVPGPRAVRRGPVLPDPARRGGPARLARMDRNGPGRGHLHRPPAAAAAAARGPRTAARPGLRHHRGCLPRRRGHRRRADRPAAPGSAQRWTPSR